MAKVRGDRAPLQSCSVHYWIAVSFLFFGIMSTANLTLNGDATNASMAAGTFEAKREVYRKSPIGMTGRLADEDEWNEVALERRAEELAHRVLGRWPWVDLTTVPHEADEASGRLRWHIEGGTWQNELAASQMVLNVAGALLSRDSANAEKHSGDAISSNVHRIQASRLPTCSSFSLLRLREDTETAWQSS